MRSMQNVVCPGASGRRGSMIVDWVMRNRFIDRHAISLKIRCAPVLREVLRNIRIGGALGLAVGAISGEEERVLCG